MGETAKKKKKSKPSRAVHSPGEEGRGAEVLFFFFRLIS